MRRDEQHYFKQLLEQKMLMAARDLSTIEQQSSILKSAERWEAAPYSNHLPDLVSDYSDREMAFLFAARDGNHLTQIEDALQRMEDGTFGLCKGCGKGIPRERLKALPNAVKCVPCQTLEDQSRRGA